MASASSSEKAPTLNGGNCRLCLESMASKQARASDSIIRSCTMALECKTFMMDKKADVFSAVSLSRLQNMKLWKWNSAKTSD